MLPMAIIEKDGIRLADVIADVIAGLTRHPCGVLLMKKHCFELKMQQPLLVALLLSL